MPGNKHAPLAVTPESDDTHILPDQAQDIVIAENGSPHKSRRFPRTKGDPRTKHQRYYARNRELVRARQMAAHRRKREARTQPAPAQAD
ncbi:hypothetical protein AA23498_3604 [Acetobacter nitrogenifigens DSM 23921 = NBRC 105050]|uniref:Uncharacterized protein n=1 Tax=Acetobacter nitrogenifigens DSM 23921 = NBRC 105050 TaxID=1120919 RepID=A0A511XFE6_9PROT|nr:hypothetical protein [Acetobacter nitrogenifigens]GBR00056.1 hypothetical protein AA23498_3604 [Acetobacter nitrogenifigens DSM 23921 = NBRC 105050]GEN61680.1 hypothetical protein ANI02nite_35640 [Acetobacter nitrogenifigens DSM 23921 = NBRC 105050]